MGLPEPKKQKHYPGIDACFSYFDYTHELVVYVLPYYTFYNQLQVNYGNPCT
jgi:hypothetical protein